MHRLLSLSLAAALFTMSASTALAAQTSINFNDGTDGAAIGGFYSGLGVTFQNARWDSFVSSAEGLVGAGGLKLVGNDLTPYNNKVGNPIIASFSSALTSFSVRGLNVGYNGARIDLFDGADALLASVQTIYDGPDDIGGTNHPELSWSGSGARSVRFYQPLSVSIEGMLWDNMTFTAAAVSVPEPASLALLGFGLVGLGTIARRRRA